MFSALFWFTLGAFVGWNLPQPEALKRFQQKHFQPVIDWAKARWPF